MAAVVAENVAVEASVSEPMPTVLVTAAPVSDRHTPTEQPSTRPVPVPPNWMTPTVRPSAGTTRYQTVTRHAAVVSAGPPTIAFAISVQPDCRIGFRLSGLVTM